MFATSALLLKYKLCFSSCPQSTWCSGNTAYMRHITSKNWFKEMLAGTKLCWRRQERSRCTCKERALPPSGGFTETELWVCALHTLHKKNLDQPALNQHRVRTGDNVNRMWGACRRIATFKVWCLTDHTLHHQSSFPATVSYGLHRATFSSRLLWSFSGFNLVSKQNAALSGR